MIPDLVSQQADSVNLTMAGCCLFHEITSLPELDSGTSSVELQGSQIGTSRAVEEVLEETRRTHGGQLPFGTELYPCYSISRRKGA